MAIRDAVEADLDLVISLIHELASYERAADEVTFDREDLRRSLFGAQPAAHVLIAETDAGEPAGLAVWFPTFSTWLGKPGIWLEDLFVRPEHRRQGFGRALIDALAERTDGRIEWAVLDWNDPAVAFYQRLGAAPVEGWIRYRRTPR